MLPVQVSVNTVTGVVINGQYEAVSDVVTLNKLAQKAYDINEPLLLEVENWHRPDQSMDKLLQYKTTVFYRVMPEPMNNQEQLVLGHYGS